MSKTSVNPRVVNLDRTFTYEGDHYGPGTVTIKKSTQERTDLIADALEKRVEQLQAHEGRSGAQRRDRSVTGVSPDARGTDRVHDMGPKGGPVEQESGEMFEFKGTEMAAEELWDKSDAKLKKGGLTPKQIKRIRKAQEAATVDEPTGDEPEEEVEESAEEEVEEEEES